MMMKTMKNISIGDAGAHSKFASPGTAVMR
jgi:hypothetical protein